MTTGLEVYFNEQCPFFASESYFSLWKRAEAEGVMNIAFSNRRIVPEITPLYSIYGVSFLKLVNNTNKSILRLDIAGVQHDNPTVISYDGLNIHNQEGNPEDTYNSPPYGVGILFPSIERYRKIHYDQYGVEDVTSRDYSLVGFPTCNVYHARAIRLWYQSHRLGDSLNQTGQALEISDLMPNYGDWVKKLMLAPDQDYSDSDLFENFDFTGSAIPTNWNSYAPEDWIMAIPASGNMTSADYIPQLIDYNGQKVVYQRAGFYNGSPTDMPPLWDWIGLYQKYVMTPEWKRESGNHGRYRVDISALDYVGLDNYATDNVSRTIDDDYLWNKVYDSNSSAIYSSWETDRNSSGQYWYDFASPYLPVTYFGSKLKHTLIDPNIYATAKQYPGTFQYRFREKQQSSTEEQSTAWQTGSIFIPQGNPIVTSEELQSSEAIVDSVGSVQIFQVGQIGGRGDAIKYAFDVTTPGAYLLEEMLYSGLTDRKIYEGDVFHYEFLLDSKSNDNGLMIDMQIDNASGGSDPFWVSEVDSTIFTTSQTDSWQKISVDLTQWEGKVIKKIAIRYTSSPSITTNGKMLGYFQNIHLVNNTQRFMGKQFMVAARVYTANLSNSNTNGVMTDFFKPVIKFYVKRKDSFDNIYWYLATMKIVGQYENKNGFYWIRGIFQIEYDPNAIEFGIGIGLYQKIPDAIYSGGYGPADNGGYMMVERFSMEPMSKLHLVSVYSMDNATSYGDPVDDYHLIKPNDYGYKAWATQVFGRYFEEWEE